MCMQRITKRARHSETNIQLEYVRRIHELHEKNLEEAQKKNMNILVIDIENKSIPDICNEIMGSDIYKNVMQLAN